MNPTYRYLIVDDTEPEHKKVKHGYSTTKEILEIMEKYPLEKYNKYISINQVKGLTEMQSFVSIVFDIDDHEKEGEDSIEVQKQKVDKLLGDCKEQKKAVKVVFTGRGYSLRFPVKENNLAERKDIKEIYSHCWNTLGKSLKQTYGFVFDKGVCDFVRVWRVIGSYNTTAKKNCEVYSLVAGDSWNTEKLLENYKEKKEPSETPTEKPTKTLERLLNIKDRKLRELLAGEWQPYGYNSRSEAESALVSKLIFYKATKKQVFEIMEKHSLIGKWKEAPEQYKEMTYNKALKFLVKEVPADNREVDALLPQDFVFETRHLPHFEDYSKSLGLYGKAYSPYKKLQWYAHVSMSIARNPENIPIQLNRIKTDCRVNAVYVIPSGRGKMNLKMLTQAVADRLLVNYSQPSTFHPEQFVGKNVLKITEEKYMEGLKTKTRRKKQWVKILGYFSRGVLQLEECFRLLDSKEEMIRETRALINRATDPYPLSVVEKKAIDVDWDQRLHYPSQTIFEFYLQPRKISNDAVEDGFMRRSFCPYVKIPQDDSIFNNRVFAETDSKTSLTDYVEYLDSLRGKKEYKFTEEAKGLVASLPTEFIKQAGYYRSDVRYFASGMGGTLQNNLVKLATILSLAYGLEEVPPEIVKLAFLDLTELWGSQLSYVNTHVIGALDYGESFAGADAKDQPALAWLIKIGAYSFDESAKTSDFVQAIANVRKVSVEMARKDLYRLEHQNFVKTKQVGKTDHRVWLAFTPKVVKGGKGGKGGNPPKEYFNIIHKEYEQLLNFLSDGVTSVTTLTTQEQMPDTVQIPQDSTVNPITTLEKEKAVFE